MRKKIILFAALMALVSVLTGCRYVQDGATNEDFVLPEPSAEPDNMFLGERVPSRLTGVELYTALEDGAGFSTVKRGIRADVNENPVEATVRTLLSETGDVKLLGCEVACGLVTVDLSIDARATRDEQAQLSLMTAISNTLLGFDYVQGVNVLIGGQSECFARLPHGVQTAQTPSVAVAYAQMRAEYDHLSAGDGTTVTRNAVLYFPAPGGKWLVPELRVIELRSTDYAGVLIDALKQGPVDNTCASDAFPEGIELIDPQPAVETLSTGEHALTLNFAPSLYNCLAISGLEMWQFSGSVTLSACSFLPELDAVRILVDGEPVTACDAGGTHLAFEDGLMRRKDFSSRIGSVAVLYLIDENGDMQAVRRPVSMRGALSPKSLLEALFAYSELPDAQLYFPSPETVSASDILGVQVSGNVARVNLSASFYRGCQTLDTDTERALVYCIVNTLCETEDVGAVRFYVEGLAAETLSGSVYIKGPLMPDPGLVSRGTAEAETTTDH